MLANLWVESFVFHLLTKNTTTKIQRIIILVLASCRCEILSLPLREDYSLILC